jgi:hypothetical protein
MLNLTNPNGLIDRHQQPPISLEPIYNFKKVKFIAILPESSIPSLNNRSVKVDINFYLIKYGSINDSPLVIQREAATLKFNTSSADNNTSYYLFECICNMPIINDDFTKIGYFYCTKNEETNAIVKVENLLVQDSILREFTHLTDINISSSDRSNRLNRLDSVNATATDRSNRLNRLESVNASVAAETTSISEQIDGLVLFTDDKPSSGYTEEWCIKTLNVLLRLDYLFNRTLDKESHSNFMQRLVNVFKYVVNFEKSKLFSQFMVTRFERELNEMSNNEYLEEWQYISLITMFFISNKFNVGFANNLEKYQLIFKLHRPRLTGYFKMLKDYFFEYNV